MAQYQLIIRAGPNAGKAYPLEGSEITIGRDSGNTIRINDSEVSRRHAKLVWKSTGFELEDLGSTNGTFVNGQRISAPYKLSPGEAIGLGENIVVAFEGETDPNATMVASKRAGATGRAKPAAAPTPAYAGQVPAGPEYVPEKSARKRISPLLLVGIIVGVLICSCAIFFVIVDQLNLWCTIFPFLFPGAC